MQDAAVSRENSIRSKEKKFCSDFAALRAKQIERYNNKAGDLTGFDCKLCHNKGHFLRLIDGREVYEECGCMEMRKSLRQIKQSGLERAIQVKTFDSFEEKEDWQRK